jgi:hypothetical protein
LTTSDEITDPQTLAIKTHLNGQARSTPIPPHADALCRTNGIDKPRGAALLYCYWVCVKCALLALWCATPTLCARGSPDGTGPHDRRHDLHMQADRELLQPGHHAAAWNRHYHRHAAGLCHSSPALRSTQCMHWLRLLAQRCPRRRAEPRSDRTMPPKSRLIARASGLHARHTCGSNLATR